MERSLPSAERLSLWSRFKQGVFAAPEDHFARHFVLRQMGVLAVMVSCIIGELYVALDKLHHEESYFWWLEWSFRHEVIKAWAFACVSCLILVGILERVRARLARGDESEQVKMRLKACHYGQRAFIILAAAAVGVMLCLYVENLFHLMSVPREDKSLAILIFSLWGFIPFLSLGWAYKYHQMHFMRLARMLDVPKPKAKLNALEQWWVALVQRHFERCCVLALGLFAAAVLCLFIWPLTPVERLGMEMDFGGLRLAFIYFFASLMTQIFLVMFLRKKILAKECTATRGAVFLNAGFYVCLAFVFIFAAQALYQCARHGFALKDMTDESLPFFIVACIPALFLAIFIGLIFSFQVTFKYHFRSVRIRGSVHLKKEISFDTPG